MLQNLLCCTHISAKYLVDVYFLLYLKPLCSNAGTPCDSILFSLCRIGRSDFPYTLFYLGFSFTELNIIEFTVWTMFWWWVIEPSMPNNLCHCWTKCNLIFKWSSYLPHLHGIGLDLSKVTYLKNLLLL